MYNVHLWWMWIRSISVIIATCHCTFFHCIPFYAWTKTCLWLLRAFWQLSKKKSCQPTVSATVAWHPHFRAVIDQWRSNVQTRMCVQLSMHVLRPKCISHPSILVCMADHALLKNMYIFKNKLLKNWRSISVYLSTLTLVIKPFNADFIFFLTVYSKGSMHDEPVVFTSIFTLNVYTHIQTVPRCYLPILKFCYKKTGGFGTH